MDATDTPLTVRASAPSGPYLHLDNRALIIYDGRGVVMFPHGSYMWLSETLKVLAVEKRATRQQGPNVFGGFTHEDGSATLFAGTVHHLVTVEVGARELTEIAAKLER